MTKLTADPALQSKLIPPAEITDESGRTIGYFISPQQFERIHQLEEDRKALYAWANSLISDEELAAAAKEGGEHSPDEVRAFLKRIEAAERQLEPAKRTKSPRS
jgi:hypothetical protein